MDDKSVLIMSTRVGFTQIALLEYYTLHNPLQVYIYVVEKSTGNVLPVVYTSEPFFFFHVINAFQVDVDKYIYLDIMAYKDAEVGMAKAAFSTYTCTSNASSFQILSDLKFSHIERTDHVPTARPYRIKLPLNMVSCVGYCCA